MTTTFSSVTNFGTAGHLWLIERWWAFAQTVTFISDRLYGVDRKAVGDSAWWPYDNLRHEDLLKFLLFLRVFLQIHGEGSIFLRILLWTHSPFTMYVPAMAEVSPDLEVISLYFYLSLPNLSSCFSVLILKVFERSPDVLISPR